MEATLTAYAKNMILHGYCGSAARARKVLRVTSSLKIEPVAPRVLAAFLPRWHQIGGNARGVDAVAASIEQLQGIAIPASAWERLVLPARIADYSPAMLDEMCSGGEVLWAGSGFHRAALAGRPAAPTPTSPRRPGCPARPGCPW